MQTQQPVIALDPPWWYCENGCQFRCGENRPAQCPVCRSVRIEMAPEVKLDDGTDETPRMLLNLKLMKGNSK